MRKVCTTVLEIVLLLILIMGPAVFSRPSNSYALQLNNRSVTIAPGTPSAIASHSFQMNVGSTSNVGSIVFSYCSNSPLIYDSCTAPTGLDLTAATLAQQTGNTGFVIDTIDSTANKLVISRPAVPGLAVPSSYVFSNITNPSSTNKTTYVRISTYLSTQGTGPEIDFGSVAFSTTTNFQIGAYVPPYLDLCVGVVVSTNCSQTTGFGIDLGILSPLGTKASTTQFSASTNDVSGYATYIIGNTMTSGNNIIPSNTISQPSVVGVSEFGVNLRANSNPAVGADPNGAGTSVPIGSYNLPNQYIFNTGDQIANSPTSTAFTRMTVSYVVNVSKFQQPGIYSTTLTYLVVAQF